MQQASNRPKGEGCALQAVRSDIKSLAVAQVDCAWANRVGITDSCRKARARSIIRKMLINEARNNTPMMTVFIIEDGGDFCSDNKSADVAAWTGNGVVKMQSAAIQTASRPIIEFIEADNGM